MPGNYQKQGNTFSSYKHENDYSILVGVHPTGGVAFVSKPFEGSISDNKILEDCGFFPYLDEGDWVLADRGFTCHWLFAAKKAHLVTPSFKPKNGQKFSEEEILKSQALSKARIYVEQMNERAKNWTFIHGPVSHYKEALLEEAVFVCFFLANCTQCLVE